MGVDTGASHDDVAHFRVILSENWHTIFPDFVTWVCSPEPDLAKC